MVRCVLTPQVGCVAVWGASKNARMTWWRDDAREMLGWAPVDSADNFTAQLQGVLSGDPVQERYVGGGYCAIEYSREEQAPSWSGAQGGEAQGGKA
jgi:uronate dehydrogenase